MKKVFIGEISKIFEIKKGRIRNKITTLYASAMSNDIDIVKILLSNLNVDVNKKSVLVLKIRAPLHLAVDKKNIGIIQLLLKQKEINFNILDEDDKKPIERSLFYLKFGFNFFNQILIKIISLKIFICLNFLAFN